MYRFAKSALISLCVSLILVTSALPMPTTTSLAVPSFKSQPRAAQPQIDLCSLLPSSIPCALPELPIISSLPLVHVVIPDRTGIVSNNQPVDVSFKLSNSLQQAACTSMDFDLKILIITADPTDTQTTLPAIKQALDYQGTPYTVFTASPRPADPTTNRLATLLSSGCHGNFEGVILGNGQVAYNDPTAGFESALTDPEWQSLYSYERTFGVRQVTWYTFPDAQYGFNPPSSSGDTTSNPISASYTSAGQSVYSYANTSSPLTIQNVWAYKATPSDANTSALLSDSSGDALVAVKTYADGTQNLAMTFDNNPYLVHSQVLAYGAINWVTHGLFLGERHVFISPQVDDVYIDDHIWSAGTACGSNPELTSETYRINGADFQEFAAWQQADQLQPTTGALKVNMVFVGSGTVPGTYNPDTLTQVAQTEQGAFNWINHTYNHTNLDNTTYAQTLSELTQNNQFAQQTGFTNFNTLNFVSPDISGLSNPSALQAMYDSGIRYVVSDTSRAGMNNPSPNIGIYNQYQPAILEIPRRPNNLFYNVSLPEEWIEEYNCFYSSYWGRNLTYPEVLDKESQVLLSYLLNGEMDPWMFHQPNLRAYDNVHSLLGDLVDAVMAKYNAVFSLPVVSPTMDSLGSQMANRMAYSSANVTASIVPNQTITITSQQAAVVPVTGLNTSSAEIYGGQSISHISLSAGQTVTISLGNPPPNTPTPTSVPTLTSTPTATSVVTNTPTITPPTATPTSIPSTVTNTPLPPTVTNTPLPTATNTPVPTTCAPPVANNDSYSMHLLNVQLNVAAPGVLGNDVSSCGRSLSAVLVSGPSNGLLSLNSNGSFTYTPLTSLLTFSDSFTYQVFDGSAYSNVATVTIQVAVP